MNDPIKPSSTRGVVQPTESVPAVDIELTDLRCAVVLSEELHFGRAAARLHLSQPGLTYRVRRLEEALGFAVFNRTNKSVELTPAGQTLVQGAAVLLADAHELVRRAERVAAEDATNLRIGFTASALWALLPSVIQRCGDRFPSLALIVTEETTEAQLERLRLGDLDAGIVFVGEQEVEDIRLRPLSHESIYLAIPAGHWAAEGGDIDLRTLAQEPFVLFPRTVDPYPYDSYMAAFDAASFEPRAAHQAVSLQAILSLVVAGVGLSPVPGWLVKEIARPGLVFRRLSGDMPGLTLALATPARGEHPAIPQLLEVLIHVCAGEQRSGAA